MVDRVSPTGNERIFLELNSEKYPLLSNIDLVSYDVFDQFDAQKLMLELNSVRKDHDYNDLREHFDAIARLLLILANTEGATVTFSPFLQED